jgi:hypothetical protein
MKKMTAPIPFAGSQLDQTRHVCAFFNSPDEEYRVLRPFIKNVWTPASAAAIPNWPELSLPVQVLVDPPDANAAEATPHP